jgi:ABC-2 type transport system permease protein
MKAIFLFAFIQIKRFFRDPVALFFTLLFPLLFLFVFGSIFRGNDDISFDVAVINHSDTIFAREFTKDITSGDTLFKIKDVTSFNEAKELMGRGELDSIIELPKTFGATVENSLPAGKLNVYYNEASPETGQTLASIMQTVLDEISDKLTQTKPLFNVVQKSTSTANLTQFDYIFSGLLGFSIMSLGIFGLANQLPADKKNGSLRRVRATPFRTSQVIIGTMLYYGLIGLLSISVMMIVGLTVFNFDMRGDWLQLTPFLLIALVMLLGFGLLIGGWSKNENQSAILSNIISFPMMFLSGVFFPRYLMPEWLQNATGYLPLAPIVDGIRYITTESKTLIDLAPELAVIGVWMVLVYALAIKLFRWE